MVAPQTMKGRTAIVSGSSAGIGAAIAEQLSARGANVLLNYPFPELESECDEVGKRLISPWIAVCADLSTVDGASLLVDSAVKKFGSISILVNNAAAFPFGPTSTLSVADWDRGMDLNARGVFLLTKAVLPHLTPYKPSSPPSLHGVIGGSRIICIGSAQSRIPQPGGIIYAATKGAIDSMIKVWAKELPPTYGCTVNGVAPGPVYTQTFANMPEAQLKEFSEIYSKDTPVEGAFADTADIAGTVAFLAEDGAKWINGEMIVVTGGMIMA